MRLIDIKLIKQFLEKTDTDHNDLLIVLIEQVTAAFENYTGRKFEAVERTKYFSAGPRNFLLPAFPVDLGETFTATVNDDAQVIDEDFFVWEDQGRVEFVRKTATDPLPLSPAAIPRPKSVVIVWTGGWTADDDGLLQGVPQDFQKACMMQVAFEFRRRDSIGVTSLSVPDGNTTVLAPTDLLPGVRTLLDSHKFLKV